jgi:hypothetical protein
MRRYAIVSSGDLADAAREVQAMTGTIGPIKRDVPLPESQRAEHVRAPSSVVEHVTFNHGVLGSIPRGPTILRSHTSHGELRMASQVGLSVIARSATADWQGA